MNVAILATLVISLPQSGPPPDSGHFNSPPLDALGQALTQVRTIDGTGNNLTHPAWGSAGVALRRVAPAAYADGVNSPAGTNRSSPRLISNLLVAQSGSIPNQMGASDFVWQWGQFIDHDIDETPVADPTESFDIAIPLGDRYFDPLGFGGQVIAFSRSARVDVARRQEQVNEITSFIDGSNVYGSDPERARELRTLDGTGRLKTSAGDLLPFNEAGLPNAPSSSATFFLAGDFRANEQIALTAMHTLFVREHNYWAARIAAGNRRGQPGYSNGQAASHGSPDRRTRHSNSPGEQSLTGDEIYELARAIVAAELQVITYRDFLPVLLGPGALAPYAGYRDDVDPSITNEFATAAYRFGHSMLSPTLRRLGPQGLTISAGDLALANAFFNPTLILETGIEPLLRGLASQRAQAVDNYVIDDVRNFLFGPPGAGGFDLPALNLQRGRDHGLADYNTTRQAFGLRARGNFKAVSSVGEVQARLAVLYRDVNEIDLWIGGLSEDPLPGALVGETIFVILRNQFEALRDGDRFWYENSLPVELIQLVEEQDLARIIRRNTSIGNELQQDVFRAP